MPLLREMGAFCGGGAGPLPSDRGALRVPLEHLQVLMGGYIGGTVAPATGASSASQSTSTPVSIRV